MASDLETLVAQVWSPDVRPLAEEAWRCYNVGAIRASIAATWSAVMADIISKLVRLADEGDSMAVPFRAEVVAAQALGLTREAVRAMQKIEDSLLDKAVEFELIEPIDQRELGRIREDRHLCVHPSLRTAGDVYEPRPEVARGHLAVALTALLAHPPTQGGKLLGKFQDYICDPLFVPTKSPLQAGFYDRVRVATRRSLVTVAAKAAVLETDPAGRMPAEKHADRMAVALEAFSIPGRDVVRDAVAAALERLSTVGGAAQLRVLARLGTQDYFWVSISPAQDQKFTDLLHAPVPVERWEPLPGGLAACFALVASSQAREHLPNLEARFAALEGMHQVSVMQVRPDRYFVPAVITLLATAGSFRFAELVGQLAVQHAAFLDLQKLGEALDAWRANDQCRLASMMPDLSVQLFHATEHMGPARIPGFVDFQAKCAKGLPENDSFRYLELAAALRAVEALPTA